MNLIRANAILLKARERLTPVDQWTQGKLARDSARISVWPSAPDAVCWCVEGAIIAESIKAGVIDEANEIADLIGEAIWPLRLPVFNATHPPAEVLALRDTVIGHNAHKIHLGKPR